MVDVELGRKIIKKAEEFRVARRKLDIRLLQRDAESAKKREAELERTESERIANITRRFEGLGVLERLYGLAAVLEGEVRVSFKYPAVVELCINEEFTFDVRSSRNVLRESGIRVEAIRPLFSSNMRLLINGRMIDVGEDIDDSLATALNEKFVLDQKPAQWASKEPGDFS